MFLGDWALNEGPWIRDAGIYNPTESNLKNVDVQIQGCPSTTGSWTTFLFEHIFDKNTGRWMNRWSADDLPIFTAIYSVQKFPGTHVLGFSNEPNYLTNTPIRNFSYQEV